MDGQYHFQTVVCVNPYGLDTDLCARTLAENYTAYGNTRSFKYRTKTELYKLKSEFSDRSHTATIEAFKEEVKKLSLKKRGMPFVWVSLSFFVSFHFT